MILQHDSSTHFLMRIKKTDPFHDKNLDREHISPYKLGRVIIIESKPGWEKNTCQHDLPSLPSKNFQGTLGAAKKDPFIFGRAWRRNDRNDSTHFEQNP